MSDATCGNGYFCDTKVTQLCLPTVGKGAPCVEVRAQTLCVTTQQG